MFIKTSQSGYNRHGEQFTRGSFLLLFSTTRLQYRAFDPNCGGLDTVTNLETGKIVCCAKHAEFPKWDTIIRDYGPMHTLYACVRHVSLRQCGHFMMGSARIAGQSVTVSGAYGSDGLPRDYEQLTPDGREKLTRVPDDIAAIYWKGDGWNSTGNEAPTMRQWALETFKR